MILSVLGPLSIPSFTLFLVEKLLDASPPHERYIATVVFWMQSLTFPPVRVYILPGNPYLTLRSAAFSDGFSEGKLRDIEAGFPPLHRGLRLLVRQ